MVASESNIIQMSNVFMCRLCTYCNLCCSKWHIMLFAKPCLSETVAFGVLAGIWQHVPTSDWYVGDVMLN